MAAKKSSAITGGIDPDTVYPIEEIAFLMRNSVDQFKRKYLWTDKVPYSGEGNDILVPGCAMVQYAVGSMRRHSERMNPEGDAK